MAASSAIIDEHGEPIRQVGTFHEVSRLNEWSVLETGGSGDCQFYAFGLAAGVSMHSLRLSLAKLMRLRPDTTVYFDDNDRPEDIERPGGYQGSEASLVAMCKLYGYNCCVVHGDQVENYMIVRGYPWIYLEYVGNGHAGHWRLIGKRVGDKYQVRFHEGLNDRKNPDP